mgnify:CR=1 FL=1
MQRQHPGPVAADLLNRIHDDTGGDEIAARADLWLKLNVLLTEAVPESTTDGAARTIERLSAQAPQRVCTRTFSLGDVIWKCRTCQVGDETCVASGETASCVAPEPEEDTDEPEPDEEETDVPEPEEEEDVILGCLK